MKLFSAHTLRQVSNLISATPVGPDDFPITGLNEIHDVEPGDLTFVDIEKYYKKALESAATVILINQEVEVPEGKAIIVSEDPFRDFNFLTDHFRPEFPLNVEEMPSIGQEVKMAESAVTGKSVTIGEGTQVAPGVVIRNNVRIGSHCFIHPNVTIYDHTVIGDHVTINAGAVIGGEAFYFKTRPESRDKMLTKGRVVIHDHVDIGANTTIDRGVTGDTIIGAWTKIDNLVQIGHDVKIGRRCTIASQVGIAGYVIVEDEVTLWGQVGVVKDLTIGKGATLMGKTGVMSSLEGGKTYLGMIASDVRSVLRETAAIKKLPEMIRWWERREKE